MVICLVCLMNRKVGSVFAVSERRVREMRECILEVSEW